MGPKSILFRDSVLLLVGCLIQSVLCSIVMQNALRQPIGLAPLHKQQRANIDTKSGRESVHTSGDKSALASQRIAHPVSFNFASSSGMKKVRGKVVIKTGAQHQQQGMSANMSPSRNLKQSLKKTRRRPFRVHSFVEQSHELRDEADRAHLADLFGELERAENITIVFASETGDREWMPRLATPISPELEPDYASQFHAAFVYIHNNPNASQKATTTLVRNITGIAFTGYEASHALNLTAAMTHPQLLQMFFSSIVYKQDEAACPFAARVRAFLESHHRSIHYELMDIYRRSFLLKYTLLIGKDYNVSVADYFSTITPLIMFEWLSRRPFSAAYSSMPKLVETSVTDVVSDLCFLGANSSSIQLEAYEIINKMAITRHKEDEFVASGTETTATLDAWIALVLDDGDKFMNKLDVSATKRTHEEMTQEFDDILHSLLDFHASREAVDMMFLDFV